MNKTGKKQFLLLLSVLGGVTLLLSTQLSSLTFQKGLPLPEIEIGSGTVYIPHAAAGRGFSVTLLAKILVITILGSGLAVLVYKLIRKIQWKKAGTYILYFSLFLLIATCFLFILFLLPQGLSVSPGILLPQPEEQARSPLGDTPVILIWILGIMMAGLVLFILLLIIRSPDNKDNSPHIIELEALHARNELLKGGELKDTVISCYKNMCKALWEEQEIQRDRSMTVEEFEKRITAAGAPAEAVHQLTGLFEAVRYGNGKPGPGDQEKALRCFNAIISYFSGLRQES